MTLQAPDLLSRTDQGWQARRIGPDEAAPRLDPQSVHVWLLRLDRPAEPMDRLLSLLSADEVARFERYRHPVARQRFLVCRALKRTVLGAYLGMPPDRILFRYGPRGKPEVDPLLAKPVERAVGSPIDLRFNLSHSADWGLLAIGRGRDVGVDIEQVRPMPALMDLARRYFAPAEIEALEAVEPAQREAAFFTCWTRKEAFIKATGQGLWRALDRFAVNLDPEDPRLLSIEAEPRFRTANEGSADQPDPADNPEHWTYAPIRPIPGYAAALLASGRPCSAQAYRLAASAPADSRPSPRPDASCTDGRTPRCQGL